MLAECTLSGNEALDAIPAYWKSVVFHIFHLNHLMHSSQSRPTLQNHY